MLVRELIAVLQGFPPNAEVVGTRAGTTVPEFEAYMSQDGHAIMDAEYGMFKIEHQGTTCEVCGVLASGRPWRDKPVCGEHWTSFDPAT